MAVTRIFSERRLPTASYVYSYDWKQGLVAAGAGAVTSGASVFIGSAVVTVGGRVAANAAVGAVLNATQTATLNAWEGKSDSVSNAFILGSVGGAAGSYVSDAVLAARAAITQSTVSLDLKLAALDFAQSNPEVAASIRATNLAFGNALSSGLADIATGSQVDLQSWIIPEAYGASAPTSSFGPK